MDKIPSELCLRIFSLLDPSSLASAIQDFRFQIFPCSSAVQMCICHLILVDLFYDFHETQIRPVCRRWNSLASDNTMWCKLFIGRWGTDALKFSPEEPSSSSASSPCKTWKRIYEVRDRCHRVGLGLKIIREGREYYLVHHGEIQRCLGSTTTGDHAEKKVAGGEERQNDMGIAKRILFFIGDLETASSQAKKARR